ncbi:MAG: methyltransferase domain-containing protein [Candidatus Eremiobacteraeota bacterium]|nr:methyltransferase domain-containing protein [Candidatus Eremiobacteraeota bacterium]
MTDARSPDAPSPSPYERLATPENVQLLESLASFDETHAAQAAAQARRSADHAVASAALATSFARRRARAARKFSRANEMFFTRAGYEQSSSEAVARHRAERFARYDRIADLCCGIGSDTIALATAVRSIVDAADLDDDALACARLNARVHGVERKIRFHHADALRWPLDGDAAFADPARRSAQERTHDVARYQPPLHALLERAAELPGRALAVKVAPGLRADVDSLREACGAPVEVEVVSERGVCKEAVLWCGELGRAHGALRATIIDESGVHELDGRRMRAPISSLRRWLGEPDAAVIRAGLLGELCTRLRAHVLDPHVAYMSADEPQSGPYARWYEVLEVLPFSVKRVRAALRVRAIGRLVIKTRAFPMRPEELSALLKARGGNAAVLVCATIGGSKTAIVCRSPSAPLPT